MIDITSLNFEKSGGLLPCVVQHHETNQVLMVGFMNKEALLATLEKKMITFFSRSRNRLWTKGETSGNNLHVMSLTADCDGDTLLAKVKPTGPVCHTGKDTCFGEAFISNNLTFLENVIQERKQNPGSDSYTRSLFDKGMKAIAQKVGEEAVELILEAEGNNQKAFLNEAADLTYHFLVLLAAKESSLREVIKVLQHRHEGKK